MKTSKAKSFVYSEERNQICTQILNILNLDETTNTFLLHELDEDIDKQNKILALENDIRTYFRSASWRCFANDNVKRKVLSIIKNVLKDMNYDIIPKRIIRKNNDIIIRDSIYYIIKK
jgi:hypothetical protein